MRKRSPPPAKQSRTSYQREGTGAGRQTGSWLFSRTVCQGVSATAITSNLVVDHPQGCYLWWGAGQNKKHKLKEEALEAHQGGVAVPVLTTATAKAALGDGEGRSGEGGSRQAVAERQTGATIVYSHSTAARGPARSKSVMCQSSCAGATAAGAEGELGVRTGGGWGVDQTRARARNGTAGHLVSNQVRFLS